LFFLLDPINSERKELCHGFQRIRL
jgi:hypothetical protein